MSFDYELEMYLIESEAIEDEFNLALEELTYTESADDDDLAYLLEATEAKREGALKRLVNKFVSFCKKVRASISDKFDDRKMAKLEKAAKANPNAKVEVPDVKKLDKAADDAERDLKRLQKKKKFTAEEVDQITNKYKKQRNAILGGSIIIGAVGAVSLGLFCRKKIRNITDERNLREDKLLKELGTAYADNATLQKSWDNEKALHAMTREKHKKASDHIKELKRQQGLMKKAASMSDEYIKDLTKQNEEWGVKYRQQVAGRSADNAKSAEQIRDLTDKNNRHTAAMKKAFGMYRNEKEKSAAKQKEMQAAYDTLAARNDRNWHERNANYNHAKKLEWDLTVANRANDKLAAQLLQIRTDKINNLKRVLGIIESKLKTTTVNAVHADPALQRTLRKKQQASRNKLIEQHRKVSNKISELESEG